MNKPNEKRPISHQFRISRNLLKSRGVTKQLLCLFPFLVDFVFVLKKNIEGGKFLNNFKEHVPLFSKLLQFRRKITLMML